GSLLKISLCLLLGVGMLLLPLEGPMESTQAQAADPGGFLNILPPGQDGTVNTLEWGRFQLTGKYPKHVNDQTEMYDSLAEAAPGVKEGELPQYFKEASLGLKGEAERSYSPT